MLDKTGDLVADQITTLEALQRAEKLADEAELRQYSSSCCGAFPSDEVEIDSVDGDYGRPEVVAMGVCSECGESGRFSYQGSY